MAIQETFNGNGKLMMTQELLAEIECRPMSAETEALVYALKKAWFQEGHNTAITTGKAVVCPYCEQTILVQYHVEIAQVSRQGASEKTASGAVDIVRWRQTLTMSQLALLESATRNGVLDSFRAALDGSNMQGKPNNPEKYFLDWLRQARPRDIPSWAMRPFTEFCNGKTVGVYSAQFIAALVANGELLLFLPLHLITGIKSGLGESRILPTEGAGIDQWIKTKMGYVPRKARFFLEEMQRRSSGEFAKHLV